MSINWFPGHMHKARKEIAKVMDEIDVIIEVLDARLPRSSENPLVEQLRKGKPVIKLLNKSDLADPKRTQEWLDYFNSQEAITAIAIDYEQKKLIGILCRGAFAIALGDQSEHEPRPLDKVILDFRNRQLAQRIIADDSQRIYITYGAAHLPGVLASLQAADPAWQITTVKWMRGMATPEHLEGALPSTP